MNNWMNDWKTIDNDDEICLLFTQSQTLIPFIGVLGFVNFETYRFNLSTEIKAIVWNLERSLKANAIWVEVSFLNYIVISILVQL